MGRWGYLTRVGILHCREGKTRMTWKDSEQGRKTLQNQILLITRTVRQNTIVRIKSSLSTFPPCLPGLPFTDNIYKICVNWGRVYFRIIAKAVRKSEVNFQIVACLVNNGL
ncbi:hypothetical protein NIES73_05140 [Sphaerospermopsis kisseleviana NIES-73]|nr:hypothetical protein NIES73_05140 [Sphaerospermopsis kisseleviana NIES-73]